LTFANGKGSITISGVFFDDPLQVNNLAITGGTGDFVGASGQADIVVTPNYLGNPLSKYYYYKFITSAKYWS
jgi:hypothetical protein